jgi:hypothetical protein
VTFSDALQPGSVPWPLPTDNRQDFPTDFGSETWPELWPKLVFSFPSAAERGVTLAGLGSTDRAWAFLEDSKLLTRWDGSSWLLATPWVQRGTQSMGVVAANGTLDVTINFPVSFGSTDYNPTVMTSFQAGACTPTVVTRSVDKVQLRFFNNTGSATTAATVYWTATRTQ